MKSLSLFILFSILLSNSVSSQIQKVTRPFYKPNTLIGVTPYISNDYAIIDGFQYLSQMDSLFVYKHQNDKWELYQIIDVPPLGNDFEWSYQLYDNRIINLRRLNLSVDTIFINENNGQEFILKDKLYYEDNSEKIKISTFGDWIMIWSDDSQLNHDSISYQTTRFFKHIDNKWVLIDTFNHSFPTGRDYPPLSTCRNYTQMNDKFTIINNSFNSEKNYYSGKIDIYKLENDHWKLNQSIYAPDTTKEQIYFGRNVSLSPQSNFLAAMTKDSGVYIYSLINDKYEFFQKIDVINPMLYYHPIVITENEFFVASPKDDKKSINYYKLINGKFEFQCKIYPPGIYRENIYKFRGYNAIDKSGETLIVSDQSDFSQDSMKGAVYFIQIPARASITDTICSNEEYLFGDRIISESGIYYDTLQSSYCVDSIVRLDLTIVDNNMTEIDTFLCDGQSLNIANDDISDPGDYIFTLQNIYGCDSIVNLHLEYSEIDTSSTVLSDLGCDSGELKIDVEGNNPPFRYKWSNGFSDDYISGLSSGDYSLEVKDNSGCTYNYSFTVPDSIPYLMPNAFIPADNNEYNKIFWIYLADQSHDNPRVKLISTMIFDRWGNKVFESEGNNFWDGTRNGTPMPPQVYLYSISIQTPCGIETKNGQVTLLR
ncbi:MAG: gliding motility-associated C-terminal domain-containing protein [Saprospiraceae bacterium]